jgi:hypothetical protein
MSGPAEGAADPAGACAALAGALAAHGVRCRVEARGRLAVLAAADHAPLADPATRRRVATLAMAHGFTHVALELDPPPDDREALRST